MIPDLTLCRLAADAYAAPPTWRAGDAFACLSEIEGAKVIALRGTDPRRMLDLATDCDAVPVFHRPLGWCHQGFLADALAIAPLILRGLAAADRIVLTGHSKGGAEALLLGALMVAAGHPPEQIVTFGAARAGRGDLQALLAAVPGADYRHGRDPVPEMPLWLDLARPAACVAIGRAGEGCDPLVDHELAGYADALGWP